MTLYETIFKRRSVRKYETAPLDETAIDEIMQYVNNATQLQGQSARFSIVSGDVVKKALSPYAILAYSEDSDDALINIGYTLQGVDLWLQSSGYGSVWCGMATPRT